MAHREFCGLTGKYGVNSDAIFGAIRQNISTLKNLKDVEDIITNLSIVASLLIFIFFIYILYKGYLRKNASLGMDVTDNEKHIKHLLFFFGFITIFVSAGFFGEGIYYDGHDLNFHLLRIESVAYSIGHGDFLAPIHYTTLEGYGYGTGLFYSNVMIYFPALLRVLGASLVDAYRITIVFSSFATLFTMYYFVKIVTKSSYAGLIAAVLYTLSSYRLTNIYIRAAYGEIMAFIFIPLIFAGAYHVISGNSKKWYVLVFGMLGVLFSHLLSFAVCLALLIIIFIINFRKVFFAKERRNHFIIAAIFTVLLSVGFIVPMFEQMAHEIFYVSNTMSEFPIAEHALYPVQLFFGEATFGLSYTLDRGIENEMTLSLGFLLLTIPFLIFLKNGNKENKIPKNKLSAGKAALVVGWIFAFMTTVLFPWQTFGRWLASFQFPWRFLLFATFFLSIAGAIALMNIFKTKREKMITLGVVVMVALFLTMQPMQTFAQFAVSRTSEEPNLRPFAISGREYLPEGTNHYEFRDRGNVITLPGGQVAEFGGERSGNRFVFNVNFEQNPQYVELPLLFYLGYEAVVIDESGTRTALAVNSGNNSLVRVYLENYASGRVEVVYRGTLIFRIFNVVSVMSFVVLVLWLTPLPRKFRKVVAKHKELKAKE